MKPAIITFLLSFVILTGCSTLPKKSMYSTIPSGYRIQELSPIGGEILMPKTWHYSGGMTANGCLFTISKEDNGRGGYETGFRIQGLTGFQKTGKTPYDVILHNINIIKGSALSVIKECPEEEAGIFTKSCLEVIQNNPQGKGENHHVIYSFFWNDGVDLVFVTMFGAPESQWNEAEIIYSVMKDFKIMDMEKIKGEP